MIKRLFFSGLLAGLLSGLDVQAQTNAPAARGASEAAPASLAKEETKEEAPAENTLRSFRIIAERNIFNPNRSSRSSRNSNSGPRPKEVKVETFGMVGMLSSEKGLFAFFDGSSSSYRKAVKVGDKVADLAVAEIGDDYTVLKGPEKEYKVAIGMQMRRQDEGEWEVRSYSPGSTGSSSSTNSGASSAASDDSDIVKKMMQKREQESK